MKMKFQRCGCFNLLAAHFSKNGFWPVPARSSSSEAKVKPMHEIPGLSSLPLLGSLHHFFPVIGTVGIQPNFCHLAETLYKKFGTIVKFEVFSRGAMVILYEPEHFEQGQQWREFRTKVNPALLKPKLVKLYAPALDEVAKEMTARLIKIKDDHKYLQENLETEITRWSLESVALVGLGTRIGCLKNDLTDNHPAMQLMKCAKDIMQLTYKLEFCPNPWKFIPTPNYKKLVKTLDKQWEISKIYIEEGKRQIQKRSIEVLDEDKSVIEKLLAVDEKVALMMANEMLMAGIDTVAFATVGLLYHLSTNPRVQEKLREEIRSGVENRRYLKACIKESLRIWPVVPANLRRTSKDHVVGGYHIPAGIDVIAPNEFLSKMEKNYPQATEFIPERWVAEKTDPLYYGNAHPMITLPFGFGVRTCIGRRIAKLEIETLMARLIAEVNVTWEGPPIKVVTKVLNAFVKPYYFKFELLK